MKSQPSELDQHAAWLAQVAGPAHVAVGVSRLDDGRFLAVNDAFCRLFQRTRDEVIGRTSAELGLWIDPAQRDRLFELIRRHGAVSGYLVRYRNRAGEDGELLLSVRAVGDEGTPCLVGFLTEVTDQRELIEGLRATQGRLGVALRATGLLVFRQDRALRYTWIANPAQGVTEGEILGRTDAEVLGTESAAPLVAVKQRVLETGRAERRDVWVAHNGELVCYDLVVEPEHDAAGRVQGIVCAAMDITQRVTAPAVPPPSALAAPATPGPWQAIEGMTSLIGREGLSPRQVERLQRIAGEVRRLTGPGLLDADAARERLRRHHAGALVLVAEHGPVARELATALLQDAGLQVLTASNGVHAFSVAVQRAPALLLLDMEFPQRGAVAAARALRTTLQRRLPIIAMMSPGRSAEAGRALDADLDDVIDKPVSAEALYRKVLSWLEPQ